MNDVAVKPSASTINKHQSIKAFLMLFDFDSV
jgi:hypothetical protein